MTRDMPWFFEITMRLFLGGKAYHCADEANSPTLRRRRIRSIVGDILKLMRTVDTTERHRERLTQELTNLDSELKRRSPDAWLLVYMCLRIIGRLCGYDYHGARTHTLAYFQDPDQVMTGEILSGGDDMVVYRKRRSAFAVRRDLVNQLLAQGMTSFDIALVFNVSEYRIKKIRAENP